jgi:hypothetical protein
MNDRWYSVTLQASQLQSLADALQFVTLQSGSPQVHAGRCSNLTGAPTAGLPAHSQRANNRRLGRWPK